MYVILFPLFLHLALKTYCEFPTAQLNLENTFLWRILDMDLGLIKFTEKKSPDHAQHAFKEQCGLKIYHMIGIWGPASIPSTLWPLEHHLVSLL